jgi:hypothetical protein
MLSFCFLSIYVVSGKVCGTTTKSSDIINIILTSLECENCLVITSLTFDVLHSCSYDFLSCLATVVCSDLPLHKTTVLSIVLPEWRHGESVIGLSNIGRVVGQHFRTASPRPTMLYGQSEGPKISEIPSGRRIAILPME